MKKLKTTDTLILISFIVAIIWGIETYKLTDFISDSNTDLLIIAFFFLTAILFGVWLSKRSRTNK